MSRPPKRRRRPNPRKVTVRHVDPGTLRSTSKKSQTRTHNDTPRTVDPDYFERQAELKRARERRHAMNAALRPGDEVRVPERTVGIVWEVAAVDSVAKELRLIGTVFGSRQQLKVRFEEAEAYRTQRDSTTKPAKRS